MNGEQIATKIADSFGPKQNIDFRRDMLLNQDKRIHLRIGEQLSVVLPLSSKEYEISTCNGSHTAYIRPKTKKDF